MTSAITDTDELAARARAFQHAKQAQVCAAGSPAIGWTARELTLWP